MSIEKERKFVLKYLPEGLVPVHIEQGYLMFEGHKHLRIRIINNTTAILTYKNMYTAEYRSEFEFEVPLREGKELMASTDIKLEKTRYSTSYMVNHIDFDLYDNGIATVEIEFTSDSLEVGALPDYCGVDVTGKYEYSNIVMAKKNSKN